VKGKIVIYTTREMINRRSVAKGLNSRPAGENAQGGDLWICSESSIKRPAIGHNMPHFRCRWGGDREARNACFLGEFSTAALLRPRNLRGDINESAELLITGAVRRATFGRKRGIDFCLCRARKIPAPAPR